MPVPGGPFAPQSHVEHPTASTPQPLRASPLAEKSFLSPQGETAVGGDLGDPVTHNVSGLLHLKSSLMNPELGETPSTACGHPICGVGWYPRALLWIPSRRQAGFLPPGRPQLEKACCVLETPPAPGENPHSENFTTSSGPDTRLRGGQVQSCIQPLGGWGGTRDP